MSDSLSRDGLRRLKTLDEKYPGNWFPIASKNGVHYCRECGAKLPDFLSNSLCLKCFEHLGGNAKLNLCS